MHGDYLTFESMKAALNLPHEDFLKCEIRDGIWRRYPNLPPEKSRSDISRDGIMGLMFYCAVNGNTEIPKRILKAGIKNGFKMGERGNWDYISMLPIVPLITMCAYGKWIPTPPTLAIGKLKHGFRAHLLMLTVLIERRIGKRSWFHKKAADQLRFYNLSNPAFEALQNLVHDNKPTTTHLGNFLADWGGCSEELFGAFNKYMNSRLD